MQAIAGDHKPTGAFLLSPFDNLLWDRLEAEHLFGFEHRLEIYTPKPKRPKPPATEPLFEMARRAAEADEARTATEGVSDTESPDDFAWMTTDAPSAYEDLGLEPDDFDLIFAYPWPGEEQVIFDLFADCASTGALLLTYHGLEGVRLQRRVNR